MKYLILLQQMGGRRDAGNNFDGGGFDPWIYAIVAGLIILVLIYNYFEEMFKKPKK